MATHGLPAWPWTDVAAAALPLPEGLLLEAMRRWAVAAREGTPALPAMQLALVAEDAGAAAPALDAVLRAIGPGFAPREILQSRLTDDEAALLLAFALAQRGPRREALAAFLRLLPPIRAYAAMGPAIGLALAFRRAGLLLSNPLR